MNFRIFLLLLLIAVSATGQNSTYEKEVLDYQYEQNEKFSNSETSILSPEDLEVFDGLEFYPIAKKYRVEAKFVRTPSEKPFKMATSTDRTPEYVKYGEAHFALDNVGYILNLYKSTTPYEEEGYEDYLFLPFTDFTNGDGSYGGGRYVDVRIPEGDIIVIDFNKAYNPYCAYSPRYSCPIPPAENDLEVRIEAGVKEFKKH